jgi:hypothetical protein
MKKINNNQVDSKEFINLSIPPPKMNAWEKLSEWYIVNKFTYPITKLMSTSPVFIWVAKKGTSFFNNFIVLNARLKNYKKSIKRLSAEGETEDDGYSMDSDYGYSGDVFLNELMTMYKYKKMIDENYPTPNESKATYQHIIEKSEKLIEAAMPSCYFNFGICYAYSDSILAKKYPNVKFYGIERTDSARLFNSIFFSDIKNLTIFSGDIFENLKNGDYRGGIFFHSRTLLLLPQVFVRELYKAVYEAGFSYIIATEQYGISRQLGEPYKFSYEYQQSAVYRDFMYIHNYPNILNDCGFKLNRIENFKTDHWHEDVRILSFEAERVD